MLNTRVVFLLLFSMVSLQGCMQYYKVKTVKDITAQDIEKYISKNKYIVLHQDTSAWYLSNAHITGTSLSGDLVNLPQNHLKYKTTKFKGATRYRNTKNHKESDVLNEVHLYLQKSGIQRFDLTKQVMIPLSDITKTDVYIQAQGRSVFSWIVPGLIGMGVVITGIVIVAISYEDNTIIKPNLNVM